MYQYKIWNFFVKINKWKCEFQANIDFFLFFLSKMSKMIMKNKQKSFKFISSYA